MREVRVFAPATVANVACGFDILGFALEQPGDTVRAGLSEGKEVKILSISGDSGRLPLDAAKNTAGVAVRHFLDHLGEERGIEIHLEKALPLGSGLGSSAASAVAAVVAANVLLGEPLSREELIPFTLEAERAACGAAHADNAAPAMLGGFVLIRGYDPPDLVRIPAPEALCCAVVHPHIEIRTEDARKILRREIPLEDAIVQWGNIGGLIAGLMKGDYSLIGRSMKDVIIEPVRSLLIPGFEEAKQAAMDAGALGCSISGSGPSIFALGNDRRKIEAAGQAMQAAFAALHIDSDLFVSAINNQGPTVLNSF
ncbi:homoserine kinase [Anseongella ginsenosidimutans]|uniref:Homoserine kinase n=1 Tax=Anseongella ginsenosidimutans TaxID=496056 RepID=A0A4R3KPX7_9SPHI|nr:homoserine kinase [Anseongella ginsenosidimutans]QEC52263.1 homoserine kinase [Anseongella ginsenosidimutans]TCS86818.1 homoserine kinase [Anseongella ginsenosidimutans]